MVVTHLLARAVIWRNNRVLLVRAEGQNHTFLPGGHVEDGEGLEACLRRELREELGIESTVKRYLGTVEHRWTRDGTPQYELNHCFAVEAPALNGNAAPPAREGYLSFKWAAVDALDAAALQPAPLRSLLTPPFTASPWWASTLGDPAVADGPDAP